MLFKTTRKIIFRWLPKIGKRKSRQSSSRNTLDSHFIALPTDLKRRVVGFLEAREAIFLSITSKAVRSDLGLSVSSPFRILKAVRWASNNSQGQMWNSPHIATIIPIFCRRAHSITVRCRYWKEGWVFDNQGRLFITSHNLNDDDVLFSNGSVVAESPDAQTVATELSMSFKPRATKMYYLWYETGRAVSGGDVVLHSALSVGDVAVHSLCHDD